MRGISFRHDSDWSRFTMEIMQGNSQCGNPANTGRSPEDGSMIGQRRSLLANIQTTLGEHLALAGNKSSTEGTSSRNFRF